MIVGLVPMGGIAKRWSPLPFAKELLPFGQSSDGRPNVVANQVLEAMMLADVERIVVPILPDKASAVMNAIGSHLESGALVTYIAASGPTMLANVSSCVDLLAGNTVLFGMPDTVFTPPDILRRCRDALEGGIELALGVFPSSDPEELDVVEHTGGWVSAVHPKPRDVNVSSTDVWGVAAWTPDVTERLRTESLENYEAIGTVFRDVVREHPRTSRAVLGVSYQDLGTYEGYRRALAHAGPSVPGE